MAQHTSAGTTVIVDLDGLVLTSSSAMRRFIARLDEHGSGCDVVLRCSRPTARQLLRRWVGGSMPVVSEYAGPTTTDWTDLAGVTAAGPAS